MAGVALKVAADKGRAIFALAGLVLGAVFVTVPVQFGTSARGTGPELIFLALFALAAGLWLSFVTPGPSGALAVINPAVCFTFALMLSWGLPAAIGAHLASTAVLTWRWRLTVARGLLLIVQFAAAFAAASAVLRADGTRGPRGREWTSIHNAAIVGASAVAWLLVYMLLALAFASLGARLSRDAVRGLIGNGLLFNAALLVLSPVVAVTSEVSVALAALLLVPLYATQRMARLSVERERADRVDPLTLLANRTALRESFERSVGTGRTRSDPGVLVLLLLNLDRFKYINDSLGYEVGDQLLVSVASRLATVHTSGQTVARLGADEFAIVAWFPDVAAADALAARTVEAVREPLRLSGLLVEVTASVGVASHDDEGDDFVAVLRHADAAMYDAKRRGNAVAVYQGHAEDRSVEGLRLLADFREALSATDGNEIAMHYQPQMSLATGVIDGFEALLRWTHPVHGPIDAMRILSLAEQTNVMRLLTGHVIDTVTAQVAAWRADGLAPRVAVNISARDLYSETIVAQLGERLTYHRLPAHQFQVEITESALTTDPVRARATLTQLAELGIDISLDDFGTGFSSLQQVRGTPLTEIKVDQSFVKGMTSNRDDAAIVAATINLAHSLGLRAVAEGVEDEPTLARLTELGCELGQGWLISHPVPADRVPALIAKGSMR